MAREVQAAAGRQQLWDAVVIGGGAAGLSAAIVLVRAQYKTLVVDAGRPRNGSAAHVHGYLTRDGIDPHEFLERGRREVGAYGGVLGRGDVTDARRDADGTFQLWLDGGEVLRSRSVLVATGLTDELPDILGLSGGWASWVHHCPHCHGYEVRGQRIVVIGNPAVSAASTHVAALVRRYSKLVAFCLNGVELTAIERERLAAYGVRIIDHLVTRASSADVDHDLVRVELAGAGPLACDAIFVPSRPMPHDAVLVRLGASRDPETGLIAVDRRGATDIPGLWAAGNVVDPGAQVVAAAGAGSAAAIGMTGWLLDTELATAVSGDTEDDVRAMGDGGRL